MWKEHPDQDVQHAIVRLNDALCTWERSTGMESVLIIRDQGGFEHRSISGKPGVPEDVADEQLALVLAYIVQILSGPRPPEQKELIQ